MVKKIVLTSPTGRKRSLGLEIGDETLTSHGGLAAVQAFLDRIGLRQELDFRFGHLDGTEYSAAEIFSVLFASKLVGDCRMKDLDRLAVDDAVKHVLGLRKLPHPTTASRFLERMDEGDYVKLQAVWAYFLREVFLARKTRIVVDIDATPFLQWGNQEGIAKGYCPQRRGGLTYNANLAFEAVTGLPLHGILRPGNQNSLGPQGQFEDFLEHLFCLVLCHIPKVIVRADSGYYGHRALSLLEGYGAEYVISARGLVFAALKPDDIEWGKPKKGVQYGEFLYQCSDWESPRRFVIKRDLTREAQQRIDGLLDTDVVVVTNRREAPKKIIRFYNERGTAEQFIAEGKQEFAFGKYPSRRYLVNQVDLTLKLMAMGFLIRFRDEVLPAHLRRHRPGTIRLLFINVAAKLVRSGRRVTLRLTKAVRHRKAWERIAEYLGRSPPGYTTA